MKFAHRAIVIPLLTLVSFPAFYFIGRADQGNGGGKEEVCLSCHPDYEKSLSGKYNHEPFSEGDCYACHEFHGFRNAVIIRGEIFDICTECHTEVHEHDEDQIHSPISDDESCLLCHNPHSSNHKNLLNAPKETICFECHDEPSEPEEDSDNSDSESGSIHPPYLEGKCLECHSPHASTFDRLLLLPAGYVCLGCHSEKLHGIPPEEMHSANELNSCNLCHNGHQSEHQSLLHKEPQLLCLNCHKDIDTLMQTKTQHSVFEDEDCLLCHDPHFKKGALNTINAQPELCLDCHSEIEAQLELETIHPPAADEDCTICHNPHAGVLNSPENELCGDCHDIADDDFLASHAGLKPSSCSGCHNPHGSDSESLLRVELHSPFEERECEACHAKGRDLSQLKSRATCLECHDDLSEEIHEKKSAQGLCIECHGPHLLEYK